MIYTYAFGYRSREAADAALDGLLASGEVSPSEVHKVYRYACPAGHRWAIDLKHDDPKPEFSTELTEAGEQAVIPGCERNRAPGIRQLSLFGGA